jgi:hypothetical protein
MLAAGGMPAKKAIRRAELRRDPAWDGGGIAPAAILVAIGGAPATLCVGLVRRGKDPPE